jgi:hypothetical protein
MTENNPQHKPECELPVDSEIRHTTSQTTNLVESAQDIIVIIG